MTSTINRRRPILRHSPCFQFYFARYNTKLARGTSVLELKIDIQSLKHTFKMFLTQLPACFSEHFELSPQWLAHTSNGIPSLKCEYKSAYSLYMIVEPYTNYYIALIEYFLYIIFKRQRNPNVSAAPRKSSIDSLSLCICYKYFTILHSIAQFYTIVRYILGYIVGYNYD